MDRQWYELILSRGIDNQMILESDHIKPRAAVSNVLSLMIISMPKKKLSSLDSFHRY